MYSERIGIVSLKEKERILKIYERNLALNELLIALDRQSFLKDEKDKLNAKVLIDIENNKIYFGKWWSNMAKKYRWKQFKDKMWHIDFKSGEVFLVEKQCDC